MTRSTRFLMSVSFVMLVGLISLSSAAFAADSWLASTTSDASIETQAVMHMAAYTPYNLPVATLEAPGLQYYPATPVKWKKYKKHKRYFPKKKPQCDTCPAGPPGPEGPAGPPGTGLSFYIVDDVATISFLNSTETKLVECNPGDQVIAPSTFSALHETFKRASYNHVGMDSIAFNYTRLEPCLVNDGCLVNVGVLCADLTP